MSAVAPGLLSYLVSYWPMGDSTLQATDIYGRNSMSFAVDPVPITNGIIAKANDFETDNDDSFAISSNESLKLTGHCAIQAWVKLESLSADRYIVAKWTSPSNLEYSLIYSNTYGTFVFQISSDGTFSGVAECISGASISTNTWYHVVCDFNVLTSEMRIFVNTAKSTTTGTSIYNGSSPFYIGHLGVLGVFWGFDGLMCDIAIWKRTLSEGEVKTLYNSGHGYRFLGPYSSSSS